MTWRTGTKNPHNIYFDLAEGVSISHGYIREPAVAQRIVDAMNVHAGGGGDATLKDWKRLTERVRALETALGDAIDRLNGFLSAYEGAPEPSENDTKSLVVRLVTVLQTTEDT